MFIQDIESTHESTTKGKYFLITTKTDYKQATKEAKDMLKYVYPNRKTTDNHYLSQLNHTPIIYNNISIYAQVLMQFHESNPVPEPSSHKRLKLLFNEKTISTKINYINDIPQTIHNKCKNK